MPDQAIEVERRGGTDIGLYRRDLINPAHNFGNLSNQIRRLRQCSAFREVHYDIELCLVVERQHFYLDRLEVEQRQAREKDQEHAAEKHPTQSTILDQRHENRAVKASEHLYLMMLLVFRTLQIFNRRAQLKREPRRKHERGEQRKHHRHAAEHRNRHHVWPHHAAHRRHRQQSRDDRERCENGRVTHLRHRVDGRRDIDAAFFQPTPIDIFNHHDRIIDQNTDRENQRE